MRKILIILILFCAAAVVQSQNIRNQSYIWTANQSFSDSIKMSGLFGSGTVVRIDEDGYLYKASGTNIDTIPIGQVTNLRQALDSQQIQLTVDSNFVLSAAGKLDLNDTIWAEIVKASDEIYLENNTPVFEIKESDGSLNNKRWQFRGETETLRLQAITDAGAGGGDFIDFTRSGNNITSMRLLDNAVSRVDIKNSGTIVVEDTVRTGQLKAADLLYPLSDGTSGQVISTNGTGTLSFIDFPPSYVAGTNITISNDTINASAVTDSDWSVSGNSVYNATDSIGIGTVSPSVELDVNGRTIMTNINPTLTVTNTGASSALTLTSTVIGNAITLNNYAIDSVSNDAALAGNDANDLVTEQAVKSHVTNRIENDTRVSWAADVDTSARVDGFVLKWDNGTKKHFYDTAGTGGGGAAYFRGQGLTLSANTFAIGDDSVRTAMVQDDAITYSKIQNVGGNSVIARTAVGSGNLSEVALSASQLLGRGSSGNINAISLGSGLTMSGTTISATGSGTVTQVGAGNGMDFTTITGTGNITMGTPSTITGTSSNSVTSTSHTHDVNFSEFENNEYGYFLDTARLFEESKIDSGMAIGTSERVVLFTLGQTIDSSVFTAGYYTLNARIVVKATNDDTLANVVDLSGASGVQKYKVKVYVVETAQTLGRTVSDISKQIKTGKVVGSFPCFTFEGAAVEDEVLMTLNTTPTKIRLTAGKFIAVTISATYGGVADYIRHKDASMTLTRAIDYNDELEQVFE